MLYTISIFNELSFDVMWIEVNMPKRKALF